MSVGKTDIRAVVDEYVLDARGREIMMHRLYDNMTQEAIAERLDISVNTVKRTVKRWLPTVNGHLHF